MYFLTHYIDFESRQYVMPEKDDHIKVKNSATYTSKFLLVKREKGGGLGEAHYLQVNKQLQFFW